MSIYIKGLELPDCGERIIVLTSSGYVEDVSGQVIDGVKAVSVPPHGRLGDLDYIYKDFEKNPYSKDDLFLSVGLDGQTMRTVNSMFAVFRKTVQDAPTIIPADKEGSN